MYPNAHFAINKSDNIYIHVPRMHEKHDSFYYSDESQVRYTSPQFCADLHRAPLYSTVLEFYNVLQKALYSETLPFKYIGTAGRELTREFDDIDSKETLIHNCLVWSHCVPIATLLYSYQRTIYIEIAPIYPWIFREVYNFEKPIYFSFESYLENYQPYVFQEISHEIAIAWRDKAWQILQALERF